ncbi:hypothetical protein BGX34_012016 [Mortierella sp. NVP85]|nr:hypothetical protein BGX34_012016 [Mortierella sp. NVP85]
MGMKKGLEPMDIARCVNAPNPYQNSLIQDRPAVTKPKEPAAGKGAEEKPQPAPHTPAAQPQAPGADKQGEKEDTITPSTEGTKASGARQLAWVASRLALVAAIAILSL